MKTRYPGLSSFTTAQKDIFFGRKQETRDLTNLLSVERTVVLFSKSGYGKTSLLQAGVMPLLYSRQIVPVPIRFGTDALSPERHFSIQFHTAWLKFLGKTEQEAQKEAIDTSSRETFWEQIRRCPFGAGTQQFTPLLIFDQFEELFTLYPDKGKRIRFVAELADLVQERLPESLSQSLYDRLERGEMTAAEVTSWEAPPPMKFIFSIRSDMLHFMDELSESMPYILRSRYQLFGLGEAQAREAIVAPAALSDAGFASPPFGYEDQALREILTILSKSKEVESFQLQAVCQAIEEKAIQQLFDQVSQLPQKQGLPVITSEFYGGKEGIDRILEDSYNRRLDDLANIDETWTDIARRLIENGLVNKNGRRKSVDVVELIAKHKATTALLDELERQRLVRKEPRLDSFYYEISHDTWLGPIMKNRKAWEEAEERRHLLEKAEMERMEKEKAIAARRRARLIAALGLFLASIAVGAAFYAWAQTHEARKQRELAIFQKNQADSLLIVSKTSRQLAEEKSELAAAKALEAATQTEIAQNALKKAAENLLLAKKEEERARQALAEVEKEKSATEAQRQEALKNLLFAKEQTARAEFEKKKAEDLLLENVFLSKRPPQVFDVLIPLLTIDFSYWELDSISSEIGKLKNLESLNLRRNKINQLPPELGNLQNLQILDLDGNRLDDLPRETGNLQSLNELILYDNEIILLPNEIGALKNLKVLDLRRNKLTLLPQEIKNLQNLSSLLLGGNNLSSLPSAVGSLGRLKKLDLNDNKLTTLPDELGNLQNLISLAIHRNKLVAIPDGILGLQNLQSLDLGNNELQNISPAIGQTNNLQSLDLSGNKLEYLPPEIGNLQNLQEIYLSRNLLIALPDELVNLQNLKILDLGRNNLTVLPINIWKLQKLNELILSGNRLTTLPIADFKKMKNLKKLVLKDGKDYNPVPLKQVEALRAAMPWCEVVWE